MKRFLAISLGAVVLFAAMAFAQQPGRGQGPAPGQAVGGPPDGPGGRGPDFLARFLDLTDDQKAQWAALHEEFRLAVQPIHEQQKALGEELRALLQTASPDPAAVGALVIQEYELREQVRDAREALDDDLKAVLTQEQLRKYELFQQLREFEGPGPCRP